MWSACASVLRKADRFAQGLFVTPESIFSVQTIRLLLAAAWRDWEGCGRIWDVRCCGRVRRPVLSGAVL